MITADNIKKAETIAELNEMVETASMERWCERDNSASYADISLAFRAAMADILNAAKARLSELDELAA